MQIVADAILVAMLAVAAVTDLRSGRIYNWLVYPAIVLGLLLGALDGRADDRLAGLKDHALGAGVAFVALLLCYAVGGMGGGDVKLMTAVGALGGYAGAGQGNFILCAMFYAFAVGVVLGLVAAVWRRALGATVLRTWWAARVLALPGTSLDEAVPKTTSRVPFGLAIGLGTVWLLAENYTGVTLGSLVGRVIPL